MNIQPTSCLVVKSPPIKGLLVVPTKKPVFRGRGRGCHVELDKASLTEHFIEHTAVQLSVIERDS